MKQKLEGVFPRGDADETLETYPIAAPKYVAQSHVPQPLEHSKPGGKTNLKEQVAEVAALPSSLGVEASEASAAGLLHEPADGVFPAESKGRRNAAFSSLSASLHF